MTRSFQAELTGKYSPRGPRYTSYPTALPFHARLSHAEYIRHPEAGTPSPRCSSLYAYIPFC